MIVTLQIAQNMLFCTEQLQLFCRNSQNERQRIQRREVSRAFKLFLFASLVLEIASHFYVKILVMQVKNRQAGRCSREVKS